MKNPSYESNWNEHAAATTIQQLRLQCANLRAQVSAKGMMSEAEPVLCAPDRKGDLDALGFYNLQLKDIEALVAHGSALEGLLGLAESKAATVASAPASWPVSAKLSVAPGWTASLLVAVAKQPGSHRALKQAMDAGTLNQQQVSAAGEMIRLEAVLSTIKPNTKQHLCVSTNVAKARTRLDALFRTTQGK